MKRIIEMFEGLIPALRKHANWALNILADSAQQEKVKSQETPKK